MITVIAHPNGYISVAGCPNCDDAEYLYWRDDGWDIDTDDGLRGYTARFCPMCGVRLPVRVAVSHLGHAQTPA